MSAKRYFKFDELEQYLDNEADINYFAINQARRVAVGNMLGDFDEYGFYVLDEEIIKELIAMPKVVVDNLDNIDLLRGGIKFDNFIHFMLVIEDDKAKLVLLEKINFESNVKDNVGRYSNMNEYVLGEVTIPDRDVDKNVIYSKFNIRREDEGRLYDFNNLTPEELEFYKNVIRKMKYNVIVKTNLYAQEDKIEKVETNYFNSVVNSFDMDTSTKEDFLNYLNAIIKEKQIFVNSNKPFFQKTINEILDGAIYAYLSKLPMSVRVKIEEEIRKAKDEYFYQFNNLVHLQFVTQNNVKVEDKSIIANNMVQRDNQSRILMLEIEQEKMKEDYSTLLRQKQEEKEKVVAKKEEKAQAKKEDKAEVKKEEAIEVKKEERQDNVAEEKVLDAETKKEEPTTLDKKGVTEDKGKQKSKTAEASETTSKQTSASKTTSSKTESFISRRSSTVTSEDISTSKIDIEKKAETKKTDNAEKVLSDKKDEGVKTETSSSKSIVNNMSKKTSTSSKHRYYDSSSSQKDSEVAFDEFDVVFEPTNRM